MLRACMRGRIAIAILAAVGLFTVVTSSLASIAPDNGFPEFRPQQACSFGTFRADNGECVAPKSPTVQRLYELGRPAAAQGAMVVAATSCVGGYAMCGGFGCVNRNVDNNNCGSCGVVCATGTICTAGACARACQAGAANCSGTCVEPANDANNCGSCGHACTAGQICSNSSCVTPAAQTLEIQAISNPSVGKVTNLVAKGANGFGFSSSSLIVKLLASSGTVNYWITGLPSWLSVDHEFGTVDTTGTNVTFSLNSNANSLAVGTFNGTVTFTDLSTGNGTQTRSVQVTVLPALVVTGSAFTTTAPSNGAFDQPSVQYTLSSTGGTVSYVVSGLPDWLTASSTSGSVNTSGTTLTFTVKAGTSAVTGPVHLSDFLQFKTQSPVFELGGTKLNATANVLALTTTGLGSSNTVSHVGEAVTFTATVQSGAGTPTGSVSFYDGATQLGTGNLSSGTATYQTSALAVGSHTISAVYVGDSNFNTSTSSNVSQTVAQATTATAVGSSGTPSVFGQSVTFTATVSVTAGSGTPTGTVTFADGGTSIGSAPVSGGTAAVSVSTLNPGPHTITATYGGDVNFANSTSSGLSQTVNKGATTTALDASPASTQYGEATTLTATVTVTAPASGVPTGSVRFKDGATTLGTRSVTNGTATFSATGIAVGSRQITAEYKGDSKFETSTSSDTAHTVTQGATTTTLNVAPNPAKPQRSVTMTATVAATAPASGEPAGTVTFKDGSTSLGTAELSNGTATLSSTALMIGTHSLSAIYQGSTNFTGSTGGDSVTIDPRLGSETQANTEADGAQQFPAIARLRNGTYVTLWASNGQDGNSYGIYGQRFDASGVAAGNEFQVSTTKTGSQTLPKVASLADGGFVAVWQSDKQDKSGIGIIAQLFSAGAAKNGKEIVVNTTTADDQTQPVVAGLDGGGFVVAWTSDGQDKSGTGIYAQRFDAKGKAAGVEFAVNKTTKGDQSAPAIAGLEDGGFVIAWQSDGQDKSGLGIYAQRYDSDGLADGKEFAVNKTTANDQSLPAVTGLPAGGFVIAWQSKAQDGSGLGVFMQRYKDTSAKDGAETRVNTMTANDQWQPAIAAFVDRGFVVLWSSDLQDGSGQGVYGQAFDDNGAKVDAEFQVNVTTLKDQWQPAVAASSGGGFVAAWTSRDQDGSLEGVFIQRIKVPMPDPDAFRRKKKSRK